MNGTVGVLNVGAGDTKLSFDPGNPQERIRAARIVKDMLRRGYALLVDVGDGKYQRVHDFDENKCEYIIADFDPDTGSTWPEEAARGTQGTPAAAAPREEAPKRGRGRIRKIPAESSNAVAVGRTAGG